MNRLPNGVFTVVDGEVITIDVRATGTEFLVNHSKPGGGTPLIKNQPLVLTMNESQATGTPKSTTVTLVFSFSDDSGGRYDWTVSGSEGGLPFEDFVEQAGEGPESVRFRFRFD